MITARHGDDAVFGGIKADFSDPRAPERVGAEATTRGGRLEVLVYKKKGVPPPWHPLKFTGRTQT